MWLCVVACLGLLCGNSMASPSPDLGIKESLLSEDALKLLGALQVGQNLVDAINTLAKVLNESKCCQQQEKKMPPPTNCKELLKRGETKSGVYTIYPEMLPDATPMKVFCDMETEGGGWLVFQRRSDGSKNFTLGWNQYSGGFGDLNGEFWLGNRNLNKLTAGQSNELRVDMMDGEGEKRFAKYKTFEVGPELEKFPLTVGGYSGDAGDSLFGHNGHTFSTIDQDNDAYFGDCAAQYKGGWWYSACHGASLNGPYLNGPHTSYADGIEWNTWKGYYYSLQFTEMKIRPLC